MLKACTDANVRLFVVKQNRHNSTLQLLKKQIDRGRFGKIYIVTSNVFWQRPQSYYDKDQWRGTLEMDGGALMNQASHYVDLLDWLVGPISKVYANIATLGRQIEAEDTATVNIEWKNGALGTMAVTMLTYPKNMEGSFTILGENGTVRIGGNAVNDIEKWEFADFSSDDEKIKENSYKTTSVYGFGHTAFYGNILSTLRGEANPICDGSEGIKSLEILEACYRSASNQVVIKLPLKD